MAQYAVVVDGQVVNAVVWDGKSKFDLPEGELVKLPKGAGIGWSVAEDGTFTAPPQADPPPEPTDYSIAKDVPWRRMTDAEAATMEQVLAGMSPRLRQIYNAASIINTDDELFATLQGALAQALGEDRANELLAREG